MRDRNTQRDRGRDIMRERETKIWQKKHMHTCMHIVYRKRITERERKKSTEIERK